MNTKVLLGGVVLGALLGGAGLVSPAAAEERSCRKSLRAVTVDNLRVPAGATCTLTGTKVKGTLKVERGATLVARGVRVEGSVQAENARAVSVLAGSHVKGSVQVKQGGAATVSSSRVDSDIQLDANRRHLKVVSNRVGGSIQVVGNRGGARIDRNTMKGNLQCKENSPRPTGTGNKAGGDKEDQCRRF
ncbi:hypothetical protein [Herbidospora cretacea]|uniref:hypothetical protein n=1 Tax=Herbidospora cretacea TaxID=28444 RepID=UPI000774591C|nr:hypothetical protein [Herbidospora cretacea]